MPIVCFLLSYFRSSKLKAKKRQQKRRSLQSSLDRNNSEIILQTVCSDINLIENASQSYAAKSGENVLSSKESFLDLNIDPTDTSSDSSANFSPPKLIADIQSAYSYSDLSESSDL